MTDLFQNAGPPAPQAALGAALPFPERDIPELAAEAVRARRVALAFQPVVQAAEQDEVAFYEGLARVTDPEDRILRAADFIRDIEEDETGRLLDCRALELGLGTLQHNPDLRLAINLSGRSVGYRGYQAILDRAFARDALLAERVILEISEPSALQVPELVSDFMRRYGAAGVSFALDNFGAGPTNLRMLARFTFDILKIDRRMTHGVGRDPAAQALLRAVIAMAQELDLFTVAEGVECAEDAAFLVGSGVDCLQGYFFAAPTVSPPWQGPEPHGKA